MPRNLRDDGSIIEIVIWELSESVVPCTHPFKYSLYCGAGRQCRFRYDNERGKGDHRHLGKDEQPYVFSSIEQLLEDFKSHIEA